MLNGKNGKFRIPIFTYLLPSIFSSYLYFDQFINLLDVIFFVPSEVNLNSIFSIQEHKEELMFAPEHTKLSIKIFLISNVTQQSR